MKRTKLLSGLVASIMLMASFSTTMVSANTVAVGDADINASIVIQNFPKESSMLIESKTFNVYRVMDASIDEVEDGMDGITYSVNADFIDYFGNLGFDVSNDNFSHNVAEFITAVGKGESTISEITTMQDLVASIRTYVGTSVSPTTTLTGAIQVNGVEKIESEDIQPGYYLVLDAAQSEESGSAVLAGALTTLPSRVTDDTPTSENPTGAEVGKLAADSVITIKGSVPTIDKQVWHNDLTNKTGDYSQEYGTKGTWDDVADYQIGDTIEYLITATVPADITGYKDYQYIVTDTLSDGLKLNVATEGLTVKIYAEKPAAGVQPVPGALHEETISADHKSFTLDFDMPAIKAKYPTLKTMYISFTAIVTEDALIADEYESNTVKLEYSNNPYVSEEYGEAEDKVYNYTFDINVFKTAGDGATGLEDAVFALYEKTEGDNSKDVQIYLKEDTAKTAESGIPTYVPSKGSPSDDVTNPAGVIITRTEGEFTGKFNIIGLDDAQDYVLKEIQAPDNYNAADPILIKISATYEKDPTTGIPVPSTSVSGGVNSDDFKVINTSTTLLPETGGIGTTIFTISGVVIMLGALGFLFLTKSKKTAKRYR